MDMDSLVSVVIPTYNRADIIWETIDSVWKQTYRPIELILIDDGSVDDTENVVDEWKRKHEDSQTFKFRYIYQENQGGNAARNRGIEESTGSYVAFLDSDDRWLPQKLEKQIAIFHADPEVGGVYCGLRYIDLQTGELFPERIRAYPQGDLLRELLIHDVTEGEPCWVVRKECFNKIGLFDETLRARLGWDLWIRLSAKYEIGCVPKVLVYGGNHSGERIRSDPQRELEGHQAIFNKYAYLRKQYPLSVNLAARSAMYRRRGRVYFHRGISWKKALQYQLMAILVWPFCFDSYAAFVGLILPKTLREKIHLAWNRAFGSTFLAIHSH